MRFWRMPYPVLAIPGSIPITMPSPGCALLIHRYSVLLLDTYFAGSVVMPGTLTCTGQGPGFSDEGPAPHRMVGRGIFCPIQVRCFSEDLRRIGVPGRRRSLTVFSCVELVWRSSPVQQILWIVMRCPFPRRPLYRNRRFPPGDRTHGRLCGIPENPKEKYIYFIAVIPPRWQRCINRFL